MKTNKLNRKHIQDVLSIYCSFPGVETFHDAQKGTIRAPKKWCQDWRMKQSQFISAPNHLYVYFLVFCFRDKIFRWEPWLALEEGLGLKRLAFRAENISGTHLKWLNFRRPGWYLQGSLDQLHRPFESNWGFPDRKWRPLAKVPCLGPSPTFHCLLPVWGQCSLSWTFMASRGWIFTTLSLKISGWHVQPISIHSRPVQITFFLEFQK